MANEHILIIEDDEEMVALGKLVLEKKGYQVWVAGDGKMGLQILHDQHIDLVLLDIMMKPLGGWEVLERIKADQQFAHLPVIMLTARHHLEEVSNVDAHRGQFVGYVVKPFVLDDLLDKIKGVLSG